MSLDQRVMQNEFFYWQNYQPVPKDATITATKANFFYCLKERVISLWQLHTRNYVFEQSRERLTPEQLRQIKCVNGTLYCDQKEIEYVVRRPADEFFFSDTYEPVANNANVSRGGSEGSRCEGRRVVSLQTLQSKGFVFKETEQCLAADQLRSLQYVNDKLLCDGKEVVISCQGENSGQQGQNQEFFFADNYKSVPKDAPVYTRQNNSYSNGRRVLNLWQLHIRNFVFKESCERLTSEQLRKIQLIDDRLLCDQQEIVQIVHKAAHEFFFSDTCEPVPNNAKVEKSIVGSLYGTRRVICLETLREKHYVFKETKQPLHFDQLRRIQYDNGKLLCESQEILSLQECKKVPGNHAQSEEFFFLDDYKPVPKDAPIHMRMNHVICDNRRLVSLRQLHIRNFVFKESHERLTLEQLRKIQPIDDTLYCDQKEIVRIVHSPEDEFFFSDTCEPVPNNAKVVRGKGRTDTSSYDGQRVMSLVGLSQMGFVFKDTKERLSHGQLRHIQQVGTKFLCDARQIIQKAKIASDEQDSESSSTESPSIPENKTSSETVQEEAFLDNLDLFNADPHTDSSVMSMEDMLGQGLKVLYTKLFQEEQ